MTLEEIRSKALEMAEPEFKKFEPIALENTKKDKKFFYLSTFSHPLFYPKST